MDSLISCNKMTTNQFITKLYLIGKSNARDIINFTTIYLQIDMALMWYTTTSLVTI